MQFTVDVDNRFLALGNGWVLQGGEVLPVELWFNKRGIPYRLPTGTTLGIHIKQWTSPGGSILTSAGTLTRPTSDPAPYTGTINLAATAMMALFTSAVQYIDCSIEVRWETSAGSGSFYKSARKKVRVNAPTWRSGD